MSCNLCGDEAAVPWLRVMGYDLVRCTGCDLVYVELNGRPLDLHALYAHRYSPERNLREGPRKMREASRQLRVLERLTEGRNLLDVGCGYGFFLAAAQQRGWRATGIEIAEGSATYARGTFGLTVLQQDFVQARFPDGSFDAVVIRHVLEHLPDPARALQEIHRILADGGVVALAVPNIASLAFRLNGSLWWWIDPPTHLYYFRPRTLRLLLERNGFTCLRMDTQHGDDDRLLSTALFSLNRRWGIGRRLKALLRGRPGARAAEAAAGSGNQAFWDQVARMTDVVEFLLQPALRLAWKLGWGSEIVVFARKIG